MKNEINMLVGNLLTAKVLPEEKISLKRRKLDLTQIRNE